MFRVSRCSVESLDGRIIHRITRDTTSGDTFADLSVERKVKRGFGVVECNESRRRVQSGISNELETFRFGIARVNFSVVCG
jgi:hypothetical protein